MTRAFMMALMATVASPAMADGTDLEKNTMEARAATKAFGEDMKKALMNAVATDGMAGAIESCGKVSPEVAAQHSQMGWTVGRTAGRTRNSLNAPDQWEASVLKQFTERKKAGEPLATMDYSAVVDGEFRYMKAIGAQPFCMACHGTNISAPVLAKVAEKYPADQATGYKVGDLRGAFTLRKPIP